jgi:hypothetical protein
MVLVVVPSLTRAREVSVEHNPAVRLLGIVGQVLCTVVLGVRVLLVHAVSLRGPVQESYHQAPQHRVSHHRRHRVMDKSVQMVLAADHWDILVPVFKASTYHVVQHMASAGTGLRIVDRDVNLHSVSATRHRTPAYLLSKARLLYQQQVQPQHQFQRSLVLSTRLLLPRLAIRKSGGK